METEAIKMSELNMANTCPPKSLKRASSMSFPDNGTKMKCASSTTAFPVVKRDLNQVFKSLSLMPDIGRDDLQCALCSYKANQKHNLRTHYKLKHLGGADLSMLCSICQKRCKTKSNLRSHLVNFHKLSREDAIKLTS